MRGSSSARGVASVLVSNVSVITLRNADSGAAISLDSNARQAECGLVFQFPERHFIGSNLLMELSVGIPAGMESPESYARRVYFQQRVPQALAVVGMENEPWGRKPRDLSDGYKRRLALAVQLLRNPAVLLLDEPLAGLSPENALCNPYHGDLHCACTSWQVWESKVKIWAYT